MRLEPPGETPVRILALFPHPRHIGHVVLDKNGLVPKGAFACRTRRFATLEQRKASLDRLVARSSIRHRPTLLVVVHARGCAWLNAMMAHAIAVADGSGVPLRIRHEAMVTDLFIPEDAEQYDQLGQAITRVFFPELAKGVPSWNRRMNAQRRRLRSVWKAAAGALTVLAEVRPDVVRNLAIGPLPPGLASLIDRASRPPV